MFKFSKVKYCFIPEKIVSYLPYTIEIPWYDHKIP